MKRSLFTFPILHKGKAIQLGYKNSAFFCSYGNHNLYFIANPKLLVSIIVLLSLLLSYHLFEPKEITHIKNVVFEVGNELFAKKELSELEEEAYFEEDFAEDDEFENEELMENQQLDLEIPLIPNQNFENNLATPFNAIATTTSDPMSYFISLFDNEELSKNEKNKTYDEKFLVEKQLLITRFLIQERVSRLDQLSNGSVKKLSSLISQLFIELVLNKVNAQKHVYHFFTDTTDLKKLETAFVEQIKYHVPASITLAQSALETGYGKKIMNNNYFGIKDKTRKSRLKTTTEYYTLQEVRANRHKIISKRRTMRNGRTLYKCKIKDYFIDYSSPWKSFREHSIYLNNSPRYAPLFAKGKDYKAWADKIGSTKYGGVGYATSPIYGKILKKIIKRYHLDLLDY